MKEITDDFKDVVDPKGKEGKDYPYKHWQVDDISDLLDNYATLTITSDSPFYKTGFLSSIKWAYENVKIILRSITDVLRIYIASDIDKTIEKVMPDSEMKNFLDNIKLGYLLHSGEDPGRINHNMCHIDNLYIVDVKKLPLFSSEVFWMELTDSKRELSFYASYAYSLHNRKIPGTAEDMSIILGSNMEDTLDFVLVPVTEKFRFFNDEEYETRGRFGKIEDVYSGGRGERKRAVLTPKDDIEETDVKKISELVKA